MGSMAHDGIENQPYSGKATCEVHHQTYGIRFEPVNIGFGYEEHIGGIYLAMMLTTTGNFGIQQVPFHWND